MQVFCLIVKRLTPAVRTAACLFAISVVMAAGCAEKAVEKAPVDIEKDRQDHMKMIQRESGQTMSPEKK